MDFEFKREGLELLRWELANLHEEFRNMRFYKA
jgi:hypothetical protein